MAIWPPARNELKRPVYRSLAQCVIDAVEAGELTPGTRLPPQRSLAFDLGVSVQTVSRAYDELVRLGILSGEVGRGSFVRASPTDGRVPWQQSQREDIIDCSMLVPVTGELQADCMAATLAELSEKLTPASIFSFRPRATLESHCKRALEWLLGCGIETKVERVLPTNGCTAAMTVALMSCAIPGDVVATEEIGHHTLKSLASALGLRLQGLEIDAEGIVPEAFDRACRAGAVKVLFVLPSGLNPTAAMMGEERRRQIAEIARRHQVWIVENDAWGPLQPRRPPPIANLAPERSFYFTGLTKCILPGLRMAWLVVPEQLVSTALTRHLVTNWMATPLIAEIASRWLEDGTAQHLLQWQRQHLGRRNALAARLLAGIPHGSTQNGMHLWLPLPEGWNEDAFVTHARNHGVAVAAGANFLTGDTSRGAAIRICLGAGSEAELAQGIAVVARLVRSDPEPALLAI